MRAEAMKSMMGSARKAVILTDSSKFQEHGVVLQSRLKDIDMIFTDDQIPEETKTTLENNGIQVKIVQ